MKKIAILGTFAAVVLSSCGAGAGTPKSESDSLAYAMGVYLGNYAKENDSTLVVPRHISLWMSISVFACR